MSRSHVARALPVLTLLAAVVKLRQGIRLTGGEITDDGNS
jgi:hypothetical protein